MVWRQIVGISAERLALFYLMRHGLSLIMRNYACQTGEIDLIMQDKDTLVFIEVRARTSTHKDKLLASINARKRRKIIRTAHHFLLTHRQYDNIVCRFDVIGVQFGLKLLKIDWIPNAFIA